MEPEQFVDKIPTGGLKYVLKKTKELFFKKIQNEAILKWCLQEENKKLKSFGKLNKKFLKLWINKKSCNLKTAFYKI